MSRLSIAALLVVVPLAASAQHTVLSTASCPACTAAQKAAWMATHDSTIRIRPVDVLGHRIGLNRANTYSGKAKYRPILPEKQIGCGRFDKFGLYTNDKGEWDWNIRLRPTAYSRPMHDAIRNATPAEKLQEWPCGGDCFKGEITTDNGFRDNPYFNVDVPYVTIDFMGVQVPVEPDESKATSVLTTNDTLCLYGPWVQDLGHSDHAEIHPSEVVWWRDRATGAIYALVLQDDSNRFDRQGDFRMDDQPNWSRPWSAFPRWTELRVAFAADASGTAPGLITVDDVEAHRILTRYNGAASLDGDDGAMHALQYNGNIVMQVAELEAPSDRIGVRFADVCRLSTDGGELLIGYVALQTVIGDHDRGDGGDSRDEGYYVMKITVDEPASAPAIAADFRGTIGWLRRFRGSRGAADSTRRMLAISDRPQRRTGAPTFALTMSALRAADSGLVGQLTGRQTGNAAGATSVRGTVRLNSRAGARIPLVHGATITLGERGAATTYRVPAHALAGTVQLDTSMRVTPDPDAAVAFASFAGRGVEPRAIASRLVRVRERIIEVLPEYTARRDGRSDGLGDESALGEILNDAIHAASRGDRTRLSRLFGTAQPITTTWTFRARNLTTGDTVPVARGRGAATPAVNVTDGAFANARLSILMPATGVFELVATARFTDRDGVTGSSSFRSYSHQLQSASAEELLGALGDVRAPAVAPQGATGQWGIVMSAARNAAADGVVTPAELLALRSAVGAWRRQ